MTPRLSLHYNQVVMRPSGLFIVVSVLVLSVFCYVPAVPTNDTEKAIAGGLNITEVSKLYMLWSTNGYSRTVARAISQETQTYRYRSAARTPKMFLTN